MTDSRAKRWMAGEVIAGRGEAVEVAAYRDQACATEMRGVRE